MQIHYLDIVTNEIDAVCAAYAVVNRVQFGEPDAGRGNTWTAALPDGEVAHPPMEIPGQGTFAIYIQGGIHHGLWQR